MSISFCFSESSWPSNNKILPAKDKDEKKFFNTRSNPWGAELRMILALNDFSFGPKDITGTEYKFCHDSLSREDSGPPVLSPCPSGHYSYRTQPDPSPLIGAVLSKNLTQWVLTVHLVSLPQSPSALGLGCCHQLANWGATDLPLHAVPTQEDHRQWPWCFL